MKLTITRSTFVGGRLMEASPEPVEVSEADGKQLLMLGKAVVVKPPADPEPVAVETPEAPASTDPEPVAKDDKPKSKGKS